MHPFERALRSFALSDGRRIHFFSLDSLEELGLGKASSLPFSLKVLLESLVRLQGRPGYEAEQVREFISARGGSQAEFPFLPGRVLLQDFTGVPCVVDLAALRSEVQRRGGDPRAVEPIIPVDLVIDHSIQLDSVGTPHALEINMAKEFQRNRERYAFIRWGQNAFERLSVLPPGLGICHQVNMERLARCVETQKDADGRTIAFADTCIGTDSHTTTVNSMGVLGWGVGGIEAEAAMLGVAIPVTRPRVIGVRLLGRLRAGATATDLALTVTERLRRHGVVGNFVEFFGPGLETLGVADRAPVANMAPEYGATIGFFPVDEATLRYLRETGRDESHVELVERYCREQGLFWTPDAPVPGYDEVFELDLSEVEPSVAGPKQPQERVALADVPRAFLQRAGAVHGRQANAGPYGSLADGDVLIASITSCTNTANPSLLIGAGLLAKKAVERGLSVPPHVRASFAPGSRAAALYLRRAGVLDYLEALGFHIAAYGCATCIGNSGPLPPEIERAVRENGLVVAAVLSGNRNFEGRIHPLARANFLCSPALVVAYALAGSVRRNLAEEPLGTDRCGQPVYLKDVWPTGEEIERLLPHARDGRLFDEAYRSLDVSREWTALPAPTGTVFPWPDSTYIKEPPFFHEMPDEPAPLEDVKDAAVLALLGDFVTTDHISPAGSIPPDSPAGRYLIENGVRPEEFNSFGARRGNHEVMIRGTFGSARLRNRLVGREGGWTLYHPTGEVLSIYEAAMRYQRNAVPLVVIAGKMYGAGSSRDWAAKGTALLGVKAVIAESFERIHRSNLVEMGVLPLEFADGTNAETLGLCGNERITISGLRDGLHPGKRLEVAATLRGRDTKRFAVRCRIDTPMEVEYYRHGGILRYVLRKMLRSSRV